MGKRKTKMKNDLLVGKLVHLTAENPEVMAGCFSRWSQDTEWQRLLDTNPPWLLSEKKWKEVLEKDLYKAVTDELFFAIRTQESHDLIGFIGLFDLYPQHGDALVAIG